YSAMRVAMVTQGVSQLAAAVSLGGVGGHGIDDVDIDRRGSGAEVIVVDMQHEGGMAEGRSGGHDAKVTSR
ncbi:MAG TPA: hypothetical protein PK156_51100, partial [Polyangium sp.]|nr:hypothetical protein [Polyangium sp.]